MKGRTEEKLTRREIDDMMILWRKKDQLKVERWRERPVERIFSRGKTSVIRNADTPPSWINSQADEVAVITNMEWEDIAKIHLEWTTRDIMDRHM